MFFLSLSVICCRSRVQNVNVSDCAVLCSSRETCYHVDEVKVTTRPVSAQRLQGFIPHTKTDVCATFLQPPCSVSTLVHTSTCVLMHAYSIYTYDIHTCA